jgi:cytochrome P450
VTFIKSWYSTNTLVNFMSNTLLSLARDPDLMESLRSDRSLIPAAVEESLRRDSPSLCNTRLCAEATSVADFRLDRHGEAAQLTFGWGSHLCLGAWIARQARVAMLETFMDLVGRIDLGPGAAPAPNPSPQGNGLDELE